MNRFKRFRRANPALIGYVFLVLVFSMAVFRVEQIAANQTVVSRQISLEICQSSVEQNEALISLIETVTVPSEVPDDADPALKKHLEALNERREEFFRLASSSLRDQDCERLITGADK